MNDSLNWKIKKLREFIAQAETSPESRSADGYTFFTRASPNELMSMAGVVEKILEREYPTWMSDLPPIKNNRWGRTRNAAIKCVGLLEAQEELALHLDGGGPKLTARNLHPWVWDAAKSAWEAGNYDDAVDAAARNVSSQVRAKVSRRDTGEGDLIAQLFSPRDADANNPRLRLPLPDGIGDQTKRNIHAGIIEYGKGLFTTVRNPLAHEAPEHVNMDEAEALECLAAFSLLARWVDRAEVHRS